jgi:crotonobetainyl-CoA:carnitine CoA-transferase CaiB-like acyl-CoA transferase
MALARAGGPLHGLRVIDLSPDALGAQVSQTLADFGADVLWIEPPGGSRLRRQPAFPFLARGKRSVIADLGAEHDAERIRALAETADVLIETFRPGVAERLGLGFETLSARNPGLVYGSITGFGRQGPWSSLKGYEGVVAALLGIFASFRGMHRGGHPPFVAVPWCTFAASQAALHGILAALLERQQSGRGQWVETNLAQAVTIHEGGSSAWYAYLVSQRWPEAFFASPSVTEKGIPMHHFVFRLLVGQTKDGRWLQFAQNRPRLFEAFLRELGLGWMLADPRWKGIPILDDEGLRLELWQRMLAAVRERTWSEWQQVFAAHPDIFAELFRSGSEVLDHPQLADGSMLIALDDPERGRVRQPGPLVRMTATPAVLRGPAPKPGNADATWSAGRWSPLAHTPTPPRAPLEGITILELAIQYAAPYGVTLLADLGARVIKIEPLTGDPIRRQSPQFPEVGGGKVMQGKESVAVDLHTREGVEIVQRIAARVDAVVEGFRDGAAERMGVDAGTLRGLQPDLVYLSAHGYGVGGPLGNRPSFAPTFGAACGIAAAHLGGRIEEDASIGLDDLMERAAVLRSAVASRYASADGVGALVVASSLLLGLLARARGAGGQQLASSMLLSTAHAMADEVVGVAGSSGGIQPGSDLRGPHALYRIYDAADGWIFLAAPLREEWEALADALSPWVDLRADARFVEESERRANDTALTEALAKVFSTRGRHEWQRELTAVDVACVAVNDGDPEALLMSDEIGRASGYISDVTHPVFDTHPRLAPIVRFSRSRTRARAGGLCGSETDSVLAEIGYTAEQIGDLRARNVVG